MHPAAKVLPLFAFSLALAGPVNAMPDWLIPQRGYVSVMGSYVQPDSERDADYGAGWQGLYGLNITKKLSLEANIGSHQFERESDGGSNYAYHFGIDALINANESPNGQGVFVIGGIGGAYEDLGPYENLYPQANVGVGALVPTGLWGLMLRTEARYVATFGKDDIDRQTVFGEGRFSLGLQYPFGSTQLASSVDLTDSDGDGVTESNDRCPNTPPGRAVDADGCPSADSVFGLDDDNDGVPDSIDQCPGTPGGVVVQATGCPFGTPDGDGDGVLDTDDHCPSTPTGFKVDAAGCLVAQAVSLRSINFELNADRLTSEARQILDGVAKSLVDQPNLQLRVIGHTDALGPQSYNLNLSQRRAREVKAYLVGRGISADRLSADGEGEFRPLASNDTDAGRAANRRVEFVVGF